MATNGEGGFPHLAMELLKERSGMNFAHVPYKGSGQPVNDVIAGHVDITLAGFSSVYPHVQNGRLAPIAITGKARTNNAPNVATVGETVPGYEALGWFGFFAPKGTPPANVNAFNDAVNKANAEAQSRMSAATAGMPIPPGMKLPGLF
ncbi:MAG: BUG/TctC family periplasmic protein [uncultured Lysobacter sp.]|uniref:BUG/TctC family periplasmic protein n=1 Tax=uncultured Lysobacter sp. TaxID=271060 RepID=A0A6J4KBJ7_9GAMM|nr:MAG: BUG/TctC family periplasmic protein [uncultured Lysobacter sp.]